jgi:hypothetical protein
MEVIPAKILFARNPAEKRKSRRKQESVSQSFRQSKTS